MDVESFGEERYTPSSLDITGIVCLEIVNWGAKWNNTQNRLQEMSFGLPEAIIWNVRKMLTS